MGFRVLPLYGIELWNDLTWHCACSGDDGKCLAGRPGKHPRPVCDSAGNGGGWAATKEKDEWLRWCEKWPSSNIGIATGLFNGDESGLLVLDIDGVLGRENLAGYELPVTRVHTTGRLHGEHLLYSVDCHVGNAEKTGFDLRGDGGYVVAPPSRHGSGRTYAVRDIFVSIAPAPRWLIDLAGPGGKPPPRKRRKRPLPEYLKGKLTDDTDSENDREFRKANRSIFRDRSAALRSVLLSAVNCGFTHSDMVDLIEGSTLYILVRERPNGAAWLDLEIGKAISFVNDNPPRKVDVCALSHIEIYSRLIGALSPSKYKVLIAHSITALNRGEGRYTVPISEIALLATVGQGTAHKYTRELIDEGWLRLLSRPSNGTRRAACYRLAIPHAYQADYKALVACDSTETCSMDGRGVANEYNPPPTTMTGGLHSIYTPLAASIIENDAFWRGPGLLGASLPTLKVLIEAMEARESFISIHEISRRVRHDRAYVRNHLERMKSLIERDPSRGIRLRPDWHFRLPLVADAAGAIGRSQRARDKRDLLRKERDEELRKAQQTYSLARGIPLRSDIVENPLLARTGVPASGAGAVAFVDDAEGCVYPMVLTPVRPERLPRRGTVRPLWVSFSRHRECRHLSSQSLTDYVNGEVNRTHFTEVPVQQRRVTLASCF